MNNFVITSGKFWLKMRRMSIISIVLHIFVSSLRLKHRMSLIQRALDSPGLVDYFSYPHHGQKVRKKFLEPFEGKNLPQRWGKSEISRWSDQLENVIFRLPTFFSKVSKNFSIGHIVFIFFTQTCLHSYIRPMKNLKGLWQNLRKIFRKNITPTQIAIWGSGFASILHL